MLTTSTYSGNIGNLISNMDFTIEIQGLSQLTARFAEAPAIVAPILQRALSASQAILAKHTTKETVPWRTGFLTQTFKAELTAGMLRWFPTASYAPFVEFGTKPHMIVPKDKQALYWPGAAHPVRSVNHPGTKPNQFMERIVDASKDEINAQFGSALQQITAAMAAAAIATVLPVEVLTMPVSTATKSLVCFLVTIRAQALFQWNNPNP